MEIGKIQKLQVVKKTDFGVYLGTNEEKVLLPKNQVPEGTEIGDTIEVFICRDSEDRIIATTEKPVAQVGETAYIKVKEITKFGAFLDGVLERICFCLTRSRRLISKKATWYWWEFTRTKVTDFVQR